MSTNTDETRNTELRSYYLSTSEKTKQRMQLGIPLGIKQAAGKATTPLLRLIYLHSAPPFDTFILTFPLAHLLVSF